MRGPGIEITTTRALPILVTLAACSAAPAPSSRPAPPPPAAAAPPAPARWLLTDRLGVMFDEAGSGATLPRPEPAIVDGVRLIVDGGVITASARHADRLTGFRSLPARLGGGFVLWSEDRVYRAAGFLDEPRAIADVGATGGARPWLSSVLLRTPSGLLELDPASLAVRRAPWAGVVDALAIDGQVGVRVDALGRASVTADGGRSFTDLAATMGARVTAVRERDGGGLRLTVAQGDPLVVERGGAIHREEPVPASGIEIHPAVPLLDGAQPASSRALAGEIVAQAIAWGAPLPGGRVLVTREGGVRVLAVETGLPVADADLPAIDERFAHCQAVLVGAPPRPALACSGAAGAEVVTLDGSLARPALDATFPGGDGGFVGGPRGRLAFDGRCGPEVPRGSDLGPGTARPGLDPEGASSAAPSAPEPPSTPEPEPPPDDDARVCVRADTARWIERRLRGEDARRIYRWVPGDDGAVTALILGGRDDEDDREDAGPAEPPRAPADAGSPEGVRVIHLDPDDPALRGGAFPAVPAPQRDAPYRTVDTDFWQDDEGAIRGWIRLPAEGEEKLLATPMAQGGAHRTLRVVAVSGGRSAGVRIDAAGHVTVFALPEGTTEVVTGGPYALAMAAREGEPAWFASQDGGAQWTPIEGPPVGRLEAPPDEHAPFACSSLGCAFGNGLVRIGWGSPPPHAAADLTLGPAANPKLRDPTLPTLRCRLDADPPWIGAAPPRSAKPGPARPEKPAAPARPGKPGAARKGSPREKPRPDAPGAPGRPVALRFSSDAIGELREPTWTAEIVPPFQPAAAIRRVSVSDRALHTNHGSVIPLLAAKGRDPLDLLLVVDRRRLRAGGPASFDAFDTGARFSIAAELPDGLIALLDADHDEVSVARGPAAAPVLRLARVPDAGRSRLTLARKATGALAVVGYAVGSGDVFAGDLDLGRGAVGPLAAIGRLDALAACSGEKVDLRFLAELPVTVVVTGRGAEASVDQKVNAAVLIAASGGRLCVEGVEAALPKGNATVLSAVMGKAAAASVRSGEKAARTSCALSDR